MNNKFFIIFFISILLSYVSTAQNYFLQSIPEGVITKQKEEDIINEKNRIIKQLQRQNEHLKSLLADKEKEIKALEDSINNYRRIINELQETIKELKQEIDNKDARYDKLLDRFIALIDTLAQKEATIKIKNEKIKELREQNISLRKKLAQKSPTWTSGILKKHSSIKNGYVLSIVVNTTNLEDYSDYLNSKYSRVNFYATLSRLVLTRKNERIDLLDEIKDIGDAEFKTSDVSINQYDNLNFYFKTDEKILKYDEVYPIITFYVEYYDKQENRIKREQLGIIDNIKIELK